jgi:hypothetical protein
MEAIGEMSFVEELLARYRQVRRDVDSDLREVQVLQARVAEKKRALDAIQELIRIEGAQVPAEEAEVVQFPAPAAGGTPISETAYAILTERREPLHYQPLTRAVQDRGIAIGGKNPANTLLAHLSRDERFYRPSRGTYALREWNPRARSVGVRRKKGA